MLFTWGQKNTALSGGKWPQRPLRSPGRRQHRASKNKLENKRKFYTELENKRKFYTVLIKISRLGTGFTPCLHYRPMKRGSWFVRWAQQPTYKRVGHSVN